MYWSNFFIPTLKENPADAEVVSHTLMVRAGMIRKVTSGVYNYLPYGLRAINKVAQIVREEMNRAGAIEMSMPMVQPSEIWQESGRWAQYGKELLRFKDRHNREYCLGPTHEEVITDFAKRELRSYKQLPINLYQIQSKFRDEIRPRFGLMRGREFVMKDAYSFDRDESGAEKSYWTMFHAYENAFKRMFLSFKPVAADSGTIGGSFSHEFMVLAKTGEDLVAACKKCSYGANIEKAPVVFRGNIVPDEVSPCGIEEILTPNAHSIEELTAKFDLQSTDLAKTILFIVDGKKVAIMVRGDRTVNDIKVKNYFSGTDVELMNTLTVEEVTGAPVGFAGPINLNVDIIIADNELQEKAYWITGANKKDTHIKNVYFKRDVPNLIYADMREIVEGDICPECGGQIELPRGIEVGHVFKLGTKYSSAMSAKFLDEDGKEKPFIMGCYGIGISRIVASSIEQNHDDKGMILPPPIAPFEVLIICAGNDEAIAEESLRLHSLIENLGIDVLVDDRKERPGIKFNDADLLGIPMQVIIGKKLTEGKVEVKDRRTGERNELTVNNFISEFILWKDKVYSGWLNAIK